MNDDFYHGLITGLITQPLSVTSEHATPDPVLVDGYNIKFDTHNILTEANVMVSGTHGNYTIKDGLAFFNANANLDPAWHAITSTIDVETNRLYKITCTHKNFYGRFGISSYGPGNAIYDHGGHNCACFFSNDNQMLSASFPVDTCMFIVIPSESNPQPNNTQSINVMWCSDISYNGAKETFSLGLGLYKQTL